MSKTKTKSKTKFQFDKWCELSKKDPEAFEKLRQKTINEFIEAAEANKRDRLRCLQWKIDKIRENNATPLAACVAISDMMWNSLEYLHKIYYEYDSVTSLKEGKRTFTPLPSASVIPFQARS